MSMAGFLVEREWMPISPMITVYSDRGPQTLPGFVSAKLSGAFAATLLFRWLFPSLKAEASASMVEHDQQ